LASSTKASIMLQLDVGTCIEAGSDPVEWIRSNPGRIRSIHCKDWSPEPGKGYTVLFGKAQPDWKRISKRRKVSAVLSITSSSRKAAASPRSKQRELV